MKWINTLNRVVIVIVCIVLIAALTALFLLPQIVLVTVGQWMLDWGLYIQGMDPWARLGIGVGLSLVVDLLLVVFIVLEVIRPRSRFLRVQQVAGGTANINTKSVVELLEHRIDPLPGVIQVTPTIKAKGNRVMAHVDAGVARGVNVPQTANELIAVIQSVLTDEMGLLIAGQPEVKVTVLPESGEAMRRAPSPPPATFKREAPPETSPVLPVEEPVEPPPLEIAMDEEIREDEEGFEADVDGEEEARAEA